jgi:hypothetical protein
MCYTVPTAGAIVTTFMWHRSKDVKLWWLNLLLWGGALFGMIDHLWNGELFFISKNWASDIALGFVITLSIFVFWKIMIVRSQQHTTLGKYLSVGCRSN